MFAQQVFLGLYKNILFLEYVYSSLVWLKRLASFSKVNRECRISTNLATANNLANVIEKDQDSSMISMCEGDDERVTSDGWTLVFRAYNDTRRSPYESFLDQSQTIDTMDHLPPRCWNLVPPKSRVFRSRIINNWDQKKIKQVKIAMLNNGQEARFIIFDGESSTKESWFSKGNYLSSSWTDLPGTGDPKFELEPHSNWRKEKSFYIFDTSNTGRCDRKQGWMLVVEHREDKCDVFGPTGPWPRFIYSKNDVKVHWTNEPQNKGYADSFAIYIKY